MHFQVSFLLPYVLTPKKRWTVASCPVLDVHSQGGTDEQATANLREAVQLFLETCIEMGTLGQVLKDSGFHVSAAREHVPDALVMEIPLHLLGGKDAKDHAG